MSNSATFSYAQAAKGQSAVQSIASQSSSTQSQAPSTTSTQSRDVAATPSTRAPSVAISTTSNEPDGSQNTRSSSVKPESVSPANNDSDNVSPAEKATESPGVPDQETEKPLAEVVPQSTERRGRGQTLNSQTTDASESKKPRKGKKGKTSEKESDQNQDQDKKENVVPKPELSEAPVPTVNVWTQRQEARAAKFKASPSTIAQPRGLNGSNAGQQEALSTPTTEDQKQKATQNDGVDATVVQSRASPHGARTPKNHSEQSRNSGNQGSRRGAPRGGRNNGEERASLESLGSIANNTSWPTPERAANGLKVQGQTGKSEREQKEEAGPKKSGKKKEWSTIDFVPTVNFETPIPTRSSRGGRAGGARGGRSTGVRGSHAASASIGISSHSPGTSEFANNKKDRTQENGTAPGAASVPPATSERASVDAAIPREARKPLGQVANGRASGDNSSASSKAEVSKSTPSSDSVQGTANQQHSARAASSNQRADETAKSSPTTKENGANGTRDFGFQGQNNGNRTERTRGNTRSRVGHSSMNGIPHQSHFSQGSSSYNFMNNSGPRQSSHPYTNGYGQMPYGQPYPVQAAGSQHRSRPSSGNNRSQGNGRHQSRPVSYSFGGLPYDAAMYPHGTPQYPPLFPDPNTILSAILVQLEYYFSIDNLCKDYYLRKFMDSQGFVPLRVVAQFKRMQEIASDYQLIRIACDNSSLIEFVITEDEQDMVRRGDGWGHWTLPMPDRHQTARNEGPTNYRPSNLQMAYYPQAHPYGGEAPPMFQAGMDPYYTHYANGNNLVSPTSNGVSGQSRASESQLSATVPEFSPTGISGMGSASQQGSISSEGLRNGLKSGNTDKKATAPSFDQQAPLLANGSYEPMGTEQIGLGEAPVNGVNGDHATKAY
ncbi:hypothetical protein M426DRAFT_24088 [Hypoxylon sp. CI-4A]|nr:hypothetical protein M426DRAFT_24088 [Hypoxylon sp. CI-4A]